jgi:hypothetical protein
MQGFDLAGDETPDVFGAYVQQAVLHVVADPLCQSFNAQYPTSRVSLIGISFLRT